MILLDLIFDIWRDWFRVLPLVLVGVVVVSIIGSIVSIWRDRSG